MQNIEKILPKATIYDINAECLRNTRLQPKKVNVSRMVLPIWIMSKGLPGPRIAVSGNLQLSGLLLLVQHLTAHRTGGSQSGAQFWPTSILPTGMDSVSFVSVYEVWSATQTSAKNKELTSW